MPFGVDDAIMLGGVGAKLLGGLFGGKAKKKKEEAARKAAIGAAELKNQMAEDQRLGSLQAGQSILNQLTSRGFTNISPEAAAALSKRRSYDFSKGVAEAGAGGGSDLLSGLFGAAGDVAGYYGANKQDQGAEMAGPPASQIATQPVVGVTDKLGGGSSYEDPWNYKGQG